MEVPGRGVLDNATISKVVTVPLAGSETRCVKIIITQQLKKSLQSGLTSPKFQFEF